MTRSSRARVVALASVSILAIGLGSAGCDQLNRPMGHPASSSSSSSSGAAAAVDGGDLSSEGGAAPAPTITAQPGDIHL